MPDRPLPGKAAQRLAPSAWLVALCLSLSIAMVNGLGRFAYALVLPSMQADLGLSYTEAGWLNTANAIGYLIGALASFWAVRAIAPVVLFRAGMVACAVALLATGATTDFKLLSALRIVAGIAAAPVFICSGALASALGAGGARNGATLVAINYAAGGGIGILASGLALPPLLEATGPAGWHAAWLVLGALATLMIPPAWWASGQVVAPPSASGGASWPWRKFLPIILAYLMFGIGYIGYMTFVIAWARAQGASASGVIALWSALGLATIASPFVLSPVTARARKGGGTAAALGVLVLGGTIALVHASDAALIASAVLFGLGTFMVPTTIATLIRATLPMPAWSVALAVMTVVFSAGQVIGPVLAGVISDATGSLHAGLAAGIAVLAAAALLASSQKEIGERRA